MKFLETSAITELRLISSLREKFFQSSRQVYFAITSEFAISPVNLFSLNKLTTDNLKVAAITGRSLSSRPERNIQMACMQFKSDLVWGR